MKRQRGMGFAGVLAVLVGIIFLAIVGMKMVPAYIEYFAIKKAVAASFVITATVAAQSGVSIACE